MDTQTDPIREIIKDLNGPFTYRVGLLNSKLLNALLRKQAEYHRACSDFEAHWRKCRPYPSPYERLDFPLRGGDSPTVGIYWRFHGSSKAVTGEVELSEHFFTLQKETAEALAAFEQTLTRK